MTFLRGLKPGKPRVLVTHIPLYRDQYQTCGLRKSDDGIKAFIGPQYQNMLDATTSNEVLDLVRPKLVVSGDDHDVCKHIHKDAYNRNEAPGTGYGGFGASFSGTPGSMDVDELTVSTFSWLQGVWWPGYALLTLKPDGDVAVLHCPLPGQIPILIMYGVVAVTCIAYLSCERRYGVPWYAVHRWLRIVSATRGVTFSLFGLAMYVAVHLWCAYMVASPTHLQAPR